jgi:hypothetical protein
MSYYPLTRPKPYDARTPYAGGSLGNAETLDKFGKPATEQGFQNLYKMLQLEGRVDPRLLAVAQSQNAISTQQQQDAARGASSRSGFGNSGLAAALQAAIGSAGASRSANLNYQDIADSYQRNQENLGLMNQLITQPQLGYASLSADLYKTKSDADAATKAARLGVLGSVFSSIGGMFGGCWVAEAIFGRDAVETHLARIYVNLLAPEGLRAQYLAHGQELAAVVGRDVELRESLRPRFLEFASVAEAALVAP